MHAADARVFDAVGAVIPELARAVEAAAERMERGGKVYYCGAGTSGRLCVLDASELPPTFGIDKNVVVALLAGGREAMFESREGAEDDPRAGAGELQQMGLLANDVVVGVAASGTTPYVGGSLAFAKSKQCLTIAIVCSPSAPILQFADVALVADVGPEVVAGSTRLKAGTAQKLILNMFSTALMARRGFVYRGEMVAMRPTNIKLKKRAARIIKDLTGVSETQAAELLASSEWDLPAALIRGRFHITLQEARERLARAGGNVAKALDGGPIG